MDVGRASSALIVSVTSVFLRALSGSNQLPQSSQRNTEVGYYEKLTKAMVVPDTVRANGMRTSDKWGHEIIEGDMLFLVALCEGNRFQDGSWACITEVIWSVWCARLELRTMGAPVWAPESDLAIDAEKRTWFFGIAIKTQVNHTVISWLG